MSTLIPDRRPRAFTGPDSPRETSSPWQISAVISLVLAIVCLVFVGCGGGGSSFSVPGAGEGGQYTPQEATAASNGRAVCGFFSPELLARELGVKARDETIATAYSMTIGNAGRQAAFAGCLDGLSLKELPKP